MTNVLAHRGPDDENIYVNGNVGLGHRRLSIIDLAGGIQPMSNDDGSVVVTFNGEIYNYRELKRELESQYSFRTNSDTEVLLRLYEKHGENCLQLLRGMFAFAIYDFRQRKLFAARDHLGQKPFYYHHDGELLAFGSEIKSVLEADAALRELDPQALYEYLTVRIIAPPRSMFRRVRKLPPGHLLVLENGKLEVRQYWRLQYEPKIDDNFEEVTTELEKRLRSAVEYHLVSDVPVGAFLSGGLDSSMVVAFMSKQTSRTFKTFSGDVPYKDYSELPFAKLVSQKFGTEHHPLTIHPSLVRTLPQLAWHLDEPSDPLSLCIYHLAKLARKELKVVLGGDGGDELFGGYDRYYGNILVNYYALLPQALRRHVLSKLIQLVPEGFWYRSFSHKLRWMHQLSFYKSGERYAKSLSYFYFSDAFKKRLYTDRFLETVGAFDPEACLKEQFDCDNAQQVLDRMLHADNMVRMPDHPVMILDRMTMAHGIEARSPFLDHKVAEFCASIPPHYKVRRNKRRVIQLAVGQKYLPNEITTKKKQGFSSPLTYLLKDEFSSLYKCLLTDSRLVQEGYLRQEGISTLLDQHLSEKVDHGNRLWLLCNSEVWYRMFIDGLSREEMGEVLGASTPRQPAEAS